MTDPAAAAVPSEPSAASPIADLSYRTYDGPLETRALRWWIIALANIRMSLRKPVFWILSVLAAGGYFLVLVILFVQSRLATAMGPAKLSPWPDYFMTGLPLSLFFLFWLALVTGSGSIAADTRANALLVYLSKPITRVDYLVGKWVGVFILLLGVAFAPALILYLYCLLSYTAEGFFSKDPYLLAKVALVAAIAAGLNTSLILGLSALARSPRMAGALYAGLYFLSLVMAPILSFIVVLGRQHVGRAAMLSQTSINVRHMTVPGLVEGLAQQIYWRGEEGFNALFGGLGNLGGKIPKPELWLLLAVTFTLVVLPLCLAWNRVRAVEVVRG